MRATGRSPGLVVVTLSVTLDSPKALERVSNLGGGQSGASFFQITVAVAFSVTAPAVYVADTRSVPEPPLFV